MREKPSILQSMLNMECEPFSDSELERKSQSTSFDKGYKPRRNEAAFQDIKRRLLSLIEHSEYGLAVQCG